MFMINLLKKISPLTYAGLFFIFSMITFIVIPLFFDFFNQFYKLATLIPLVFLPFFIPTFYLFDSCSNKENICLIGAGPETYISSAVVGSIVYSLIIYYGLIYFKRKK